MVRMKYRYILFKVEDISETQSKKPSTASSTLKLTDSILHECLMKNVTKYYGDFGVASIMSGFQVKYANEKTNVFIVRVRHSPHRFVTSLLPLITVAGKSMVRLRILYIGATIKQCSKGIIRYQQNYIDQTLKQIKSNAARVEFIEKASAITLPSF